MATTSMDYEAANGDRFEDEPPRNYDDRRSASPRNDDVVERRRSASPSNGDRSIPKDDDDRKESAGAYNPGSNLFVTGIHPRLVEAEVTRMFEKYGEVEKCQIMRDPHTQESRGFGFVKMVLTEQADAAIEGLQGEVIEGRTLSIEKARRNRPRTPTPGKYFGPPKREGERGGGRGGRFDDRRRGGGGYGGRDDPYRYRGYDRRYDDREPRGGGGSYRDDRGYDRNGGPPREDRGYGRRDRDDGYRSDRYRDERERFGGPRDDRRPHVDRERERFDRDRDGPRSRDPPPAGGYDGPRGDSRDPYGSDRR
ncbi:hypothetical protein MAPG_08988 [Magnaporthiopsis poae ATCC 64411]|uniref:RRM domain-containing protein n=1 Tax=Magnaporthiopsis poae (strain ATCC 64411 / 73-15) TaxID=644358 RepID=A0A0C4E8S0_MAGP6|nr:hypothetical protein MAPG_08988 [Magnaporthiopsis poae ATCC 64411]